MSFDDDIDLESEARSRVRWAGGVTRPAPVDDPAPYLSHIRDIPPYSDPERNKEILRSMHEAQLASLVEKQHERRLTIAAQFMAASWREVLNGADRSWLADQSLSAADALIARWKETS